MSVEFGFVSAGPFLFYFRVPNIVFLTRPDQNCFILQCFYSYIAPPASGLPSRYGFLQTCASKASETCRFYRWANSTLLGRVEASTSVSPGMRLSFHLLRFYPTCTVHQKLQGRLKVCPAFCQFCNLVLVHFRECRWSHRPCMFSTSGMHYYMPPLPVHSTITHAYLFPHYITHHCLNIHKDVGFHIQQACSQEVSLQALIQEGKAYPSECAICLGSWERDDVIKATPCGHAFHKDLRDGSTLEVWMLATWYRV